MQSDRGVGEKCVSSQDANMASRASLIAAPVDEVEILPYTSFHHLALILAAVFGLISIVLSWYLIWRHATHYLKPWEQKQYVVAYVHNLERPAC